MTTDGAAERGRIEARIPKSVTWQPKEDITAYELALSLHILMNMNSHGCWGYPEEAIARLPEDARRHFIVT